MKFTGVTNTPRSPIGLWLNTTNNNGTLYWVEHGPVALLYSPPPFNKATTKELYYNPAYDIYLFIILLLYSHIHAVMELDLGQWVTIQGTFTSLNTQKSSKQILVLPSALFFLQLVNYSCSKWSNHISCRKWHCWLFGRFACSFWISDRCVPAGYVYTLLDN